MQVIFPGETAAPRFSIPGARHCNFAGPVVTGVTEFFDAEHIDALKRWPGVRVQTFPISLEEIFLEICRPDEEGGEQPNFLAKEDKILTI